MQRGAIGLAGVPLSSFPTPVFSLPLRFPFRLIYPFVSFLALGTAFVSASPAPALSPRGRELVADATRLSDALWDARAGLLWNNEKHESHGVRATSWYVLGLMARDQPGDRERALAALRAVLTQQIDAPGAAWDGTFYRTAEEAQPRHDAKIWHDYDPNWRQFIGSALALLLLEFEDRVPVPDREAIERSLERAVSGELQHGRLRPSYTNIALMHGFLQGYAGQRLNRPDWVRASEEWIEAVHAEFTPHQSFDEFNSPTYYGVDLYGLALLRRHGATPLLRQRGAEMEAALWRDIAKFYHADLRNLAGPFDRTYGMDLQRYVSLTGVWLRLVLPVEQVPLPPLAAKMDHGRDFLFGPCFALLGAEIPADALPHFTQFSGERLLRRPIADGKRIATAWLGRDLMIGAEYTGLSREARGPGGQFRPATIHWRASANSLGWIALLQSSRVDAEAAAHSLSIRAIGESTFRISVPGIAVGKVARQRWTLPGLDVQIDDDALGFSAQAGDGFVDVTYRGATRLQLRPRLTVSPSP